jgi:hypothetical protein
MEHPLLSSAVVGIVKRPKNAGNRAAEAFFAMKKRSILL